MAPTVRALSSQNRAITFSLNDVEGPPEREVEGWIEQIDRRLDEAGVEDAAVVGVSFGGLVALRYAARRPARVSALILVSAPSPRWRLDRWSAAFARHPILSLPLFMIRGSFRLAPEIAAARPTWPSRITLAAAYAGRAIRSPVSARHMAAWARAWMATDFLADCQFVRAPTLLITGEPGLDKVVPVASTREYLTLIPGSRHVELSRTGHIGLITRPAAFASVVTDFVHASRVGGRTPIAPASGP